MNLEDLCTADTLTTVPEIWEYRVEVQRIIPVLGELVQIKDKITRHKKAMIYVN